MKKVQKTQLHWKTHQQKTMRQAKGIVAFEIEITEINATSRKCLKIETKKIIKTLIVS
jgi:hypothetical protein